MAPDLRDLLRDAAHTPDGMTDVDDIRRRARGVRRERRLRAVSVAAVVLVVVTAGAVQWRSSPSGRVVDLVDTTPTAPPAEPTDEPGGSSSWQPLPSSPVSPRVDPVAVWTGEEMLVWGG